MSLMPLLLLGAALLAPLQPGEPLPALDGQLLSGRAAQLPGAASGRVTLLALGFTYGSRFPVESWISRFRKEFGAHPQATFYQVPMLGGTARLGKWFIESGMRRGTPLPDQENVLLVYGDTGIWKQRLGFRAPDAPYLLLLDKHSVVRWRHTGPFDEAAYQELAEKTTALLGEP